MNIIYLNGEYIQQEKASISIMDRGFLFGDGVYEAIPIYQGHPFSLGQHLTRLQESLATIKMSPPLSVEQWETVISKLLSLNNKENMDQSIYIQVTRGPQPIRNHAIPATTQPTSIAICFPPKYLSNEILNAGLSAITLEDRRQQDCCRCRLSGSGYRMIAYGLRTTRYLNVNTLIHIFLIIQG